MGLEIKNSSYGPKSRLSSMVPFWVVAALTIGAGVLYLFGQSAFKQVIFSYSVNQNQATAVTYADNNLFTSQGVRQGEGYISDLADAIEADFTYQFSGTTSQPLTYVYSAVANVTATHKENTGDSEVKVWRKTYPLLPQKIGNTASGEIALHEAIAVPFREYNQMVAQLSSDLGVTLMGSLDVVFTVQVTGEVNGEPVNTSDTSSFSTKLAKPVFTIDTKFEKSRQNSLANVNAWYATVRPYLLLVALAGLTALGVMAVMYYSNRQRSGFMKNSYQRELATIYRLHDGVIIKSNNKVEIDESKAITLQTFNDLLSMGEQLQLPIIASEIDESATQFIVTHNDAVFVYTLGKPTDEKVIQSIARSGGRARKAKLLDK